MNLKPLQDIVVLRPREVKTTSAIIVPDAYARPSYVGEVVEVGPDVEEISVGQRVLYAPFRGTTVSQGDENVLLIAESEIVAVLE